MHTYIKHGLVAVLVLALAGCGAKSPEAHLDAARKAVQKGDYKTAEIELKSVLQEAPGNVEARLLLASAFAAKGRWADSEKELRKAREKGASEEQVLPQLAHVLVKMGKYQEAAGLAVPTGGMSANALAALQAERANALMALEKGEEAARVIADGEQALASAGGQAAFSKELELAKARLAAVGKRLDEAMAILDAALKKDGNFVDALYLKAQMLVNQGKQDEALKIYERITATKPDEALAHLAIAESKLHARDAAGAEKSLQAAESTDPNMLLVKYTRAKLALFKGNLKAANEAVQQVLKVAPDHLPTVLLDATVSYGLGNYEQSLKSANKVLAQVPGHLPSALLVAANELRRGNAKVALETLTPLLQSNPDNRQLLATLGEAHLQLKQYDKAMAYLDRVAVLQPKDAAIKQAQAKVHLAQGRADQAARELEQASILDEKSAQADLSLVMLHLSRKEFDPALKAIGALEKKLPNNPVTHNLRGAVHLGKGDFGSARKSFEQALSIKPGFYPAAANLARLDLAEKRPDQARRRFEAVLKADAKNVQAMMALAEHAAAANKEREALEWMEKAARADAKAIAPRAALVRYHLLKNAAQKALAYAREAADANPDDPEALSLLASAQMASGDKPSGLASFTRVAEMLPDSAEAHYRLGTAQLAMERIAEARASLEKALRLNPGHAQALNTLLLLDARDKNPEQALRRVRAFQAQNPRSPLGFIREGDILLGQHQYAQAAKSYERALGLKEDLNTSAKWHSALVRSGNQKLAEQKVAELLARYPKDPRVQAYVGDFHLAAGRNAEAQRIYEAMLAVKPDDHTILNNLAVVYQRQKDDRALDTAQRAYKLAPASVAVMDTLGWILLDRGQTAKALDLLKQAAQKAPQSASIRYHLAAALAKSGDKARARKELELILKPGVDFPEAEEARRLMSAL